ncbi:hypothetical protein CP973_06120 [Streptomyces albofaciens JCM 4342]|nr:hypothetical protein CP973_06120 [Streptomyces albofaciens JCM 4342]
MHNPQEAKRADAPRQEPIRQRRGRHAATGPQSRPFGPGTSIYESDVPPLLPEAAPGAPRGTGSRPQPLTAAPSRTSHKGPTASMRARPVRTALLTAAALGLLPLAAIPAAAHAQPQTGGRQHIAVHEGTDPSGPLLAAAHLYCFPAGGDHPDPAGACLKLAMANGDYTRVPAEHRACPRIYQPVTVVAHGTWRGKTTYYQRTYPNQCVANAESGDIFNLTPWRD